MIECCTSLIKDNNGENKLPKSCLILYASWTGNTEKIALIFKNVFERNGWSCDLYKVDRNTDFTKIPFNYDDYDFMCVGSPIHNSLPLEEVITSLRKASMEQSHKALPHEKIIFSGKKGITFATYSGAHLGPKEAIVALSWMDLEMEHKRFQCIGNFCCPGYTPPPVEKNSINLPSEDACYHGDISNRPNQKDFQRAEMFIEDILEEIAIRLG
ncbi:MAG: hypothetical protein EHM12_05525 [Dehalococcoidia bacterium]|nr:MAG: hypothetical protein EHM12_05525 [Dehalococcoidia bacterium]